MHYDHRTKPGNEGAIVRYAIPVAALGDKRNRAAVDGNRGAIDRNAP